MSEPALLDIQGLSVGYGRSRVLFEIGLSVPRTGALAVLGRNSVGKTTLMKAIIGELPALGGRIIFDGGDITALPPERRVRRGLGHVPQEHAVFARLSVRENLAVGALGGGGADATAAMLEMFPKLAQRLEQPASTLSGGERKMLAIARALLLKPRLLLLDEPTEGVWIGVIEEIAERLKALSTTMAIVIVEQHLELALGLAETVCVLDRGRVALQGSSNEIRNDPRLLQYLAP